MWEGTCISVFHPSQQATGPTVSLRVPPTAGMGSRAIRLTRRERQLVSLLVEGHTNKEMASQLGVSDQTIKNQLTTLYRKAGVSNRLELVVFAFRNGLGGIDPSGSTHEDGA
jgi:DNA-binding NarL/FixJ family response regulator